MSAPGTQRKQAEITRRRKRVVELRDQGKTFKEIADELGVSDALVHKDFQAVMREVPVASVETYRAHQQAQLQQMRAVVEDVIARRHAVIDNGHVVHDDAGNVVEDDAIVLAATDRLVKINDREAKLLGLDAKPEVQITGNLRYEILGLSDDDG
jgi:AraC-like DNA-binding protein